MTLSLDIYLFVSIYALQPLKLRLTETTTMGLSHICRSGASLTQNCICKRGIILAHVTPQPTSTNTVITSHGCLPIPHFLSLPKWLYKVERRRVWVFGFWFLSHSLKILLDCDSIKMRPPVTPPQLFSPHPKTPTVNDQTIPMFPFKQPMPLNNFTNFAHTHSHFALDPAMPRPYLPNPTRTRETYLKTEMCRNFQAGTCFKGRNCKFAHGVEEIRRVPPKRKFFDYSHENNQVTCNDDDQTIIKKMKLCLWFCNGGKCRHGSQCRYIHEYPDKFRTGSARSRESSAIVVGAGGGSSFHDQMVPDELDINVTAKTNVSFGRRTIAIKWQMIEKHKFGRHNKVERGNTSRAPSEPLSNSGHERPRGTAIGVCPNQLMQRKKEMLMSKGHEKIKGIYADWVDDLV